MIDRTALRLAYRPDENEVVQERISQAALTGAQQGEASVIARTLVKAVRGHKAAGLDAFLQAYDLGSDEGIALMCLAEALLRIPDAETADELIADKLSGPDWAEKLGDSRSTFVNAATFSLLLTGKVLEEANDKSGNWRAALGRANCPICRPPWRAGDPHGGQPGDEDPRPPVRLRPDDRRGP
jgi:RHH-type proline utilization regulon transcriptional repressor/proline dehydrogenase/delta 1-pyrroline-5-carboxylate dehydrogenase